MTRAKNFLGLGIFLLMAVSTLFFLKNEIPSSIDRPKSSQEGKIDWSRFSGALVRVSMESKVGVLLDEFPEAERERLVLALSEKPKSFWKDRAVRQIRLTSHRLNFGSTDAKKQLPLPPEELWNIAWQGGPEREVLDGHDVLTVQYSFSSTLLTDVESPGISQSELQEIGGVWNEPFLFPVDPEFLFQRTGFACVNEGQFPPNSVDAEEMDLFYNHRCTVEKQLSNIGCHQTDMPTLSCAAALSAKIGKVETAMRFERLPWDRALADAVRVGTITNPDGPDLEPNKEEFRQHRFTYRYIPADSCTLVEECVGGSGWRKLLMFPTADLNIGAHPLDIGLVDYFHTKNGTTLSDHGMFELSACHHHYHFSHYGTFRLGEGSDAINRKNGFCMQPTARLSNHELSPLHHRYVDCVDQGVAVGWIDEYKMGLECQWLDVSDIEQDLVLPLSFTTNPDGLLCEGTLKRDFRGDPLYEPTAFKTSTGTPLDRPQCDFYPDWLSNNSDSYPVEIPESGESYVTGDCREGFFGELRNCGLKNHKELQGCEPGKKVTFTCSIPAGSPAQVVRFCEASKVLGVGIPCTYNDALASGTIDAQKEISFTCPLARDEVETGGVFSFLSGALFPEEKDVEVRCVTKNE